MIVIALLVGGCRAEVAEAAPRPAAIGVAAARTGPPELGLVRWRRGYDAALAVAKAEGKPLLVLFDEVPGCATVNAYGHEVLSDPILADAAETLFVPVAVYNNEGGADRAVLDRFGEPAWNNPVVRFVGGDGREVAPRLTHAEGAVGLARRMVAALRATGREVPGWLAVVADEGAETTAEATFATACFWEGEGALGALPGVTGSAAGFQGGREVVRLELDPAKTSREAVERAARGLGYAPAGDGRFAPSAADDKYHLRHSPLRFVPMTPLQRTRVNAALARAGDVDAWLSPRQRALRDAIARRPDGGLPEQLDVGRDGLAAAWARVGETFSERKTD